MDIKIHKDLKPTPLLCHKMAIGADGISFSMYFSKMMMYLSGVALLLAVIMLAADILFAPDVSQARLVAKFADHAMTIGIMAFALLASSGIFSIGSHKAGFKDIEEAFSEPGRLVIKQRDGINIAYTGGEKEIEAALSAIKTRP